MSEVTVSTGLIMVTQSDRSLTASELIASEPPPVATRSSLTRVPGPCDSELVRTAGPDRRIPPAA
eukprot:10129631-Heterocapsa_arctica.AAC.1